MLGRGWNREGRGFPKVLIVVGKSLRRRPVRRKRGKNSSRAAILNRLFFGYCKAVGWGQWPLLFMEERCHRQTILMIPSTRPHHPRSDLGSGNIYWRMRKGETGVRMVKETRLGVKGGGKELAMRNVVKRKVPSEKATLMTEVIKKI